MNSVLIVFGIAALWVVTMGSLIAVGTGICRAYFNEKRRFLKELGSEHPIHMSDMTRVLH